MKINHYISALLAAICMMMAGMTSCSDHIDGPGLGGNDGDDATMQISINVVLPTMNDTRAVYERGDKYENTVNLAGGDYRLLLFRSDTRTLVCNIDPAKVKYTLFNTQDYSICEITADVDKDIRSYSGLSVVMLANWGDYPDMTVG
ncbi:MAG: hypothetical protein K2N09_02560, partial [Muribaculaceae bacterium]|nr:hypothetical protein [Muribaculaceae bacterium]